MGVNDISEKLGTYVRDNKIIIIIGLVFLLVFGSYSLGSNNNPEYKNLWQEAKSKNEKLDKQKIELIKENERLKSDQKGGISISEEKEGLKKWEEDVTRREISVTQREDDLKKEYKEYYETIGITKEEVGAAKQIRKDNEYLKQQITELSNVRSQAVFWNNALIIIVFMSLVMCIVVSIRYRNLNKEMEDLKRKMENNKQVLRATIETPSASLEQIRNVLDALTENSQPMKMINSQSDNNP
jgi:hypothetical protein